MTAAQELVEELLRKPVGTGFAGRAAKPGDFTRQLEVSEKQLVATITDVAGSVTESEATRFIEEEGLDPAEWEIANWYKGKYGSVWEDEEGKQQHQMETVKFFFRRRQNPFVKPVVDPLEIAAALSPTAPVFTRPRGSYGFLVLIGDMQFGKIDGDGTEGTLMRTIRCIDKAAEALAAYSVLYDIGHIHIAWLGDHIEGFNSQGGANTFRTELTLTEQIRLTHAVMLHALKTFAPLAEKVTMAAVPGNHGEAERVMGHGITRYDDSHDTESLISIHNAIKTLGVEGYEHVEFFVPDTDELIVLTEVAGTKIAHHHGHKWRPNKHFDWWAGQAFNRDSAMHVADLLVAGHLHHEHIEADGDRTFIGVPSMESDSTWFRHNTGSGGAPGLIVAITKDGHTPIKHLITHTPEEVGN